MIILQQLASSSRTARGLPDLDNDYSAETLLRAAIVSIALTSVVMALRFYAKRLSGGRWGFDDVLIFAAYNVNVGLCVVAILMVCMGLAGEHLGSAADWDRRVQWGKLLFSFELIYFTAVTLPKMSILCLYLRVFGWKGRMRRATQVLLGFVVATGFSLSLAVIFQCRPYMNWWPEETTREHCISEKTFFRAQCIPGFVLDILIIALPLRTIWRLTLPTAKRLALLFVFTVAGFGVIAAFIRAASFYKHDEQLRDSSWTVLTRWSVIEASCYILTNGMAHLRPILSRYAPPQVKEALGRVVESAASRISKGSGGRMSATPLGRLTPGSPLPDGAFRAENTSLIGTGSSGNDGIELKCAGLAAPAAAKLSDPPAYQGKGATNYSRKVSVGQQDSAKIQSRASIQVTTEVSVSEQ
ncbi:hypothetical protein QBC34DRAFT_441321 [Podospora aff. communis PSN243]|uniref:Rhodopsin domain-containing protein n=1 Tax=Podospora aff. communis PSN243 TaxID=3040156 RepID=A0AAV9GAQ4_9PEZI|nr:hypothetical protein QBC34DRAFT_441321 [Podospora aff. communis PSN243]